MKLRDYQRRAIDAVRAQWDAGDPNALVVKATGLGKTILFSHLGRELRMEGAGKILVVAHRDELINQARDKWLSVEPDAMVGIYKAARRDTWADVICASIQSCYPDKVDSDGRVLRRGRVNDLPLSDIGLVIVDEVHRVASPSYLGLIAAIRAASPHSLLLGVTATPSRADGIGLGCLFKRVAFKMGIGAGIEQGWLSPLRGIRVQIDVDLDTVERSKSTGDFKDDALGEAMDHEAIRKAIVDAWITNVGPGAIDGGANGRRTLAFCPTVAAATHLSETFAERGVVTDWVCGKTPKMQRKAMLAKYASGGIQVLVNVGVLTEGFDDAHTSCILMCRPTKSAGLYTQIIGRGTRIAGLTYAESVANGKSDCIVLDCVGVTKLGLASLADLSKTEPKVPGVEDEDEPLVIDDEQTDLDIDDPRTITVRGVSTYEVDLFSGNVQWARIRNARVVTLDMGHSLVCWPTGASTASINGWLWSVAAFHKTVEVLADGVPEKTAMAVAESYAEVHGVAKYLRPPAYSARQPASEKQRAYLANLVARNASAWRGSGPSPSFGMPAPATMGRVQIGHWITYLRARLEWATARPRATAVAARREPVQLTVDGGAADAGGAR